VARALLSEDFRCTLEEQSVTARLETDDDAHRFPLAGEGDHLHDHTRLASFLPVLPTEVLGKLKKSGLGLGSNENKLLGLRIDILKGGGVDGNRLVQQTLELRRKDCVDIALLDRKVVGVFPIYLRLVGGLGNVLFLGLVLLLIGCVRAGLVFLEVTNEFRVDTDRTGDNAHDVLGERPGLVGTNNGGVGHCLARTKDTDEEVFGGHSFSSESEGKGDSERETFGNGHDDQCYGNDQDVCEGDTLLGRSTMKTV